MQENTVAFRPLKRVLLGLLLLLLALPALQAKWHLVAMRPLDGYSELSPRVPFSWTDLRTGTFQTQLEKYLDDRIGFREWTIRLRNQLAYSLFGVLHANDVLLGQRQVLFQPAHIDSYLGRDYLGPEQIAFHARRVRNVQDSLARHGVQLLYVLAPGKPRFQPEDLPARLAATWPGPTNYEGFAQALPAAGVHVLDAAALFQQWKARAAHPLFPRGGTHWSGYSISLVADTLFRAVEGLTHVDLPDFKAGPGVVTLDSLRATDNDIAKGLNLLRGPTPYPMAYPVVAFAPATPRQQRPNVLLVGDSFTQSLYLFSPYLPKLFDARSRFWYYNQTTFWPEVTPNESHNVHELNLRQQVESRQLIILLATEQNLNKCGFGFIDEVYTLYHPFTAADEARIQELVNQLQAKLTWEESSHVTGEQLHQQAVAQHERER